MLNVFYIKYSNFLSVGTCFQNRRKQRAFEDVIVPLLEDLSQCEVVCNSKSIDTISIPCVYIEVSIILYNDGSTM